MKKKKVFERMEPHLGRSKAVVAIARKLLVAVWHVLNQKAADRFADPANVARSFFAHAYRVGIRNLPEKKVRSSFHPGTTGSVGHRPGSAGDLLGLETLPASKLLPEKERNVQLILVNYTCQAPCGSLESKRIPHNLE